MLCPSCHQAEVEYTTEGGLCERCWWTWWFSVFTDEDLEQISSDPDIKAMNEVDPSYPDEQAAARIELELRKVKRAVTNLMWS